MTGGKAYAILDWVYQHPAARVAEGIARVNALAAAASSDQARREAEDVGKILHRLAGACP